MSLNFSRRSFFRYIATAILTVACVGILTACQDANKPTRSGDGTLTVSSVVTKVTKKSNTEYTVELTNNADNEITIGASNFNVCVTKSDKTVSNYSVSVSQSIFALAKGKSATITVTCSGVSASSGDTVSLQYRPRNGYENIYGSWNYTIS